MMHCRTPSSHRCYNRMLSVALLLTGPLVTGSALAAPWTLSVRDASGAPRASAVVAVEVRKLPMAAAPGTRAEMAQRDRQFDPTLLVVQTGTAVHFPNFDTVRHHVYSFSQTKRFELKLYAGTPAEPVVFDKAGVAALGCNIHDRMTAHILVVDTPVFGLTDAQGLVRLDLPPGEHRVRLWHPGMGNAAPVAQTLVVPGGTPGQLRLELRD